MKKSIITLEQAKTLGRPIGKVNDVKLQSMINEVEQTIIRPMLGDTLYISFLDEENEPTDEKKTLLNGGVYEAQDGQKMFVGLLVTIAYYVYAQNVMTGDFESTRFGMVVKDGDYSQRISSKERSDIYNNTTKIANDYLNDCIAYCRNVGIDLPKTRSNARSTTGCIIHKIAQK